MGICEVFVEPGFGFCRNRMLQLRGRDSGLLNASDQEPRLFRGMRTLPLTHQ